MLTIDAYVYDPTAACWSYTTVDVDATIWAAYGTSDTDPVDCNDVTVMLPRVDCSCVRLPASCGDVPTAMATDTAVVKTEEAGTRCADLEAAAVECP